MVGCRIILFYFILFYLHPLAIPKGRVCLLKRRAGSINLPILIRLHLQILVKKSLARRGCNEKKTIYIGDMTSGDIADSSAHN